jgi:hypothetical protein
MSRALTDLVGASASSYEIKEDIQKSDIYKSCCNKPNIINGVVDYSSVTVTGTRKVRKKVELVPIRPSISTHFSQHYEVDS